MFLDYLNGACRCKLCQYGNFAQPIQLQDFLLLFSRFSIEIVVEFSNLNEMEEPEIDAAEMQIEEMCTGSSCSPVQATNLLQIRVCI